MRVTTIATLCVGLALGSAAYGQTSSPGGSPSTGPASGISPGRATGTSPEGRISPSARGLPANPGLSGEAGGMPSMRDRLDTTRPGDRFFRRDPLTDRGRAIRDRGTRERARPGESTDRFPASRLLPLRPGSPADARRERMRPPGLEPESSPSAVQRREANRRTGADFNQRECESIWDSGTGMNRQQWSASCRRVGERLDRLQQTGTPQRENPSLTPRIISPETGRTR